MSEERTNQYSPFSSSKFKGNSLNTDDIKIKQHYLEQPGTPKIHSSFLLILVIDGQGEIIINNISYQIEKGTLLWLFPYHTYYLKSVHAPLTFFVFETTLNVLMYTSINNEDSHDFTSKMQYNDTPIIQFDEQHFLELHYLFSNSLSEYEEQQIEFELVLLGNLFKIITIFLRFKDRKKKAKFRDKRNAWKIYQYMHYNFSENLTIKNISGKFQLTPTQINASLKKLTGDNFRDNLTHIRMLNARAMMRFSGLSIDFIAKFVGYKSPPSFNRHFKKLTGMTPNEFRQHQPDKALSISFLPSTPFNILQYLFEHYSEPLTSAKVAHLFYNNPAAINDMLYDEFGYNFSQLLTLVRMIFAKNFVVLTDNKIIEICSLTGYNSLRSFNRHFKEVWRESPSVFRKKYGYKENDSSL